MSSKIIIATLLVGLSSVASAHPRAEIDARASFDASIPARPSFRYEQTPSYSVSHEAPRYRAQFGEAHTRPYYEFSSRWTQLGEVDRVLDGHVEFNVGARPLRELYLRQDGWKTRVLEIEIVYANGRTTLLNIDRYLADIPGQASPTMRIDLPRGGGPISRIGLNVRNARDSAFSIYGR